VGYEFEQRPDGLPGLSAAYGLKFDGAPRTNSAEDFAGLGAANGFEMAQPPSGGQGCVAHAVGDLHQFVGVGSGVAIGADGGCDGEDGDGSVVVVRPAMLRQPPVAGLIEVGYQGML
jgi:hypothetical protein